MKTIQGIFLLVMLLLLSACEITQIVQSPLNGIGVGPAGPKDAKIYTTPYCCPSTALEIRAKEVVAEGAFQWVNFGFSVPIEKGMDPVSGIEVCYEIKADVPERTYISQTRLTDMTIPNVAHVKLDDGTDHMDPGPMCYVAKGSFTPEGAVTLALKVVFGDVKDAIVIGSIRLLF